MATHLDQHLQNLRAKPEHVKKQIAFGTSLAITLIIFGIWIGSVSLNVGGNVVAENKIDSPAKSVGNTLTASVGDAASGIWNSVSNYLGTFVGGSKVEYQASPAVVAVPGNR